MDMTGDYKIPAPRERVWAALNDPEVLKKSIPGCESLDKVSDTELTAKVRAKVGPVSAAFAGKVTLADLNPPESYTISGEGSGGVAGFAKGGARVNLSEEGSDTLLHYEAKAEVGGKLAQIGSRLVQGSAKKMADDFFGRFSKLVTAEDPAKAPAPSPPTPAAKAEQAAPAEPAAQAQGRAEPAQTRPEPAPAPSSPGAQGPKAAEPPRKPAEPEPPRPAPETRAPVEQAKPAPSPAATTASEPGLFQRPVTWVVIAIVVIVAIYLLTQSG